MKVYIDSNNICHAEPHEGYTEAEHEYFDTVAPDAFPCYRFIPDRNFIQCMDSVRADAIQRQYEINDLKRALALLGVKEEQEEQPDAEV